jgi:iron complex outermembrane receptor protein
MISTPPRLIATAAAVAAALLAAPCWAQTQPPPAEVADDSSPETAPPTEKPMFRAAITVRDAPIIEQSELDQLSSLVTTVSEQQIEDLYAQDLSSALRRVPGVVISRYNPIGAYGGGDGGAIFIRGHGSSRPGAEIATLTDGVPRFVGIWTHPLIDTFNLDMVGGINIYRSAQPVLLGNMSFGAIDMASKRREDRGAGGRFVGSWGSYDTLIGTLEYGARTDSVDYYLTAGHRESDGHRDNADGEIDTLSGRIGVQLAEAWDLTFLYEHASSAVDDPGQVGAPPAPITPNYDVGNDFAVATLSHHHGDRSGHLKLYLEDGTYDWLQWDRAAGEVFRSITDSRNYGLRIRETVTPWAGGELVLGLDHDLYGGEFVESRPAGDRLATDETFRNTAPYAMVSHSFGGSITVTPSVGVRYNSSSDFGSEWGGQAGIRLGIANHVLYANWAHAFNLPGVWVAVQYGGWGLGERWQELEAETVDHVELGWLAPLGGRWRLDLSVFRDEVENAIRFVPPPPPPPSFANIGAYTADGVEIAVQGELSERLSLFVGGTLSSADPDTVPNLPETTAVGGVTWTTDPGWRATFDLQWVDERYILNPRFASVDIQVDGYLLANAKLAMPWRMLGVELDGSIFLVGDNLSDEEYEYRVGYPMPGRMWQLGVELAF